MRYILDNSYYLCGWKGLPCAIMNRNTGEVLFYNKDQYALLFNFNGKTDIAPDSLKENEKAIFDKLFKDKIIHEASEGETRTLYYKQYKGMYKRDVHWSITGKCNYRCRHCFQSAPLGVLGEPTKEQCFDIIGQMEKCGIKFVSITGGEPLIRDDFFDIIDELKRKEIIVTTLFSNGKLIDQKLLDGFKQRNMRPSFQISFDGVGYHDWMRGMPGAEQIALDAFRLLRDNGFYAASAMCLCRENIGSIRETVKTLASVGCKGIKFQRSMPQGEWINEKEHYLSVAETFQAYLDYLPQYKEDGCPVDIQMEGFFMYSKKEKGYIVVSDRDLRDEALSHVPPCGVLQRSVYIGPNGAVTPCMSMCGAKIEKQFPNLFEMPLEDILYQSSYIDLIMKKSDYVLDHNEKCHGCRYRSHCCGGCRAEGTSQNGNDYFAIDPICCEMFTGGWVDKLYKIADELFPRMEKNEESM